MSIMIGVDTQQQELEAALYKEGRFIPLNRSMIFVFGSNEGGYHGAGAARFAREHMRAQMGVSFGPTGMCFAIPTKDATIRNTLHLQDIKAYVDHFLSYAKVHPGTLFQVTRLGCGLAGLKDEQIAPMFARAPMNCLFDTAWRHWLLRHSFWGHVG